MERASICWHAWRSTTQGFKCRQSVNRVLTEATRHGHKMCFTVLYTAKASSHAAIEEEIGQKEGELIRQHLPPLNT